MTIRKPVRHLIQGALLGIPLAWAINHGETVVGILMVLLIAVVIAVRDSDGRGGTNG